MFLSRDKFGQQKQVLRVQLNKLFSVEIVACHSESVLVLFIAERTSSPVASSLLE